MAGRGMSLASIISASQQGAAQAMAMADSAREKYTPNPPAGKEAETLDPRAQAPGSGEAAYNQEQQALRQRAMLSSHMDMGELMADLVTDSSAIAGILAPIGR